MEPGMEAGVGPASGSTPALGPVVQIDEGRIQAHLDEEALSRQRAPRSDLVQTGMLRLLVSECT
jgi:hypothetical protein